MRVPSLVGGCAKSSRAVSKPAIVDVTRKRIQLGARRRRRQRSAPADRSAAVTLPGAPEKNAQRPPEHPAEVREVRHAGLPAGNAEEQLRKPINCYEQPCRDRNRDRDDEQTLSREIPGESQQYTEYAARGANDRFGMSGRTPSTASCVTAAAITLTR